MVLGLSLGADGAQTSSKHVSPRFPETAVETLPVRAGRVRYGSSPHAA